MAGALDTAFKNAAKAIVSNLGSALDSTITYKSKTERVYNINTGEATFTSVSYADIKVPVEYIRSSADQSGSTSREAKIYITPDLIGGNQPTLRDDIEMTYGGETCTAQILTIETMQGGQTYLFTLTVKF